MKFPYRTKYKSVATIINGERFDSKREAARYCDLILLEKVGTIMNLRRQVTHPLIVNGEKVSSYRCDFMYQDSEGKTVIEDVKGYQNAKDPFTRLYRLKVAILAATTGLQVTEVK